MMKLTSHLWNEPDSEKRQFTWASVMQKVDQSIRDLHLSPHYKYVRDSMEEFDRILQFTRSVNLSEMELVGIDAKALRLIYHMKNNGVLLPRLEEIQTVYLPDLQRRMHALGELKSFLYSMVSIQPVGIEGLYTREGYLYLRTSQQGVYVYHYRLSTYVNARERSIVKLKKVGFLEDRIGTNLIQHKQDINRRYNIQLNGYLIESEIDLALQASILPIAKGKLSKYLKAS